MNFWKKAKARKIRENEAKARNKEAVLDAQSNRWEQNNFERGFFLTYKQIEKLAKILSEAKKTDIPVVGDGFEFFFWKWAIRSLVHRIGSELPEWLRYALIDVNLGITLTEEEKKESVKNLSDLYFNKYNIGFIPDKMERGIIETILDALLSFAKSGLKLD